MVAADIEAGLIVVRVLRHHRHLWWLHSCSVKPLCHPLHADLGLSLSSSLSLDAWGRVLPAHGFGSESEKLALSRACSSPACAGEVLCNVLTTAWVMCRIVERTHDVRVLRSPSKCLY